MLDRRAHLNHIVVRIYAFSTVECNVGYDEWICGKFECVGMCWNIIEDWWGRQGAAKV